MKRIVRIPVHQTSMIIGLTMGCFGVILALLMTPMTMIMMSAMSQMQQDTGMSMFPFGGGVAMLLIVPLMYMVFGYIGTAIFTLLFNLIAPRLGGLPIEFADDELQIT